MIQDLRALQAEVQAFRARLKSLPDVQIQHIAALDARITKESATLTRHLEAGDTAGREVSSNAPDLVRVWRLARSVPGLIAVGSTFRGFTRRKEDSVGVEIVYRKGHAWMVRNSLKYRGLLAEVCNLPIDVAMEVDDGDTRANGYARPPGKEDAGIVQQRDFVALSDDSRHEMHDGEDEDDDDEGDLFSDRMLEQTKIVAWTRKYLEVAGNNMKLGALPHITIYFPRILEECRNEEDEGNVRKLFDYLQRLGVSCIVEPGPVLPFEVNVGRLVKDDFGNEELVLEDGAPVQLDLTTLFVLVSDISNAELSKLEVTHQALKFQMEEESRVPCLRDRIFPIVRNRPLLCTKIAYDRFCEIIMDIGSIYEKQRASVIFGNASPSESAAVLSSVSIHTWPDDLIFPIRIQEYPQVIDPPLTADFKTRLAKDCFDCAWSLRLLVLSANMAASKTFREALFDWPDEMQQKPNVWLHAARSLTSYERPKKPGVDYE